MSLGAQASAAQPFSWNGFYVGANVGFRASEAAWPAPNGLIPMTYDYSSLGLRGALYGGYNWQFAPRWVAGVEADIGYGDHDTQQTNFFPGFVGAIFPIAPGEYSKITLKWDGSLRGRLGYLVTPSTMVFGTAGVAWQQVDLDIQCLAFPGCPASGHGETTRAGWTVGGGLETALAGNWSVRTEYRYADFGQFNIPLNFVGATNGVPIEVATHTATLGLTYRFGGNGTPPPAAWPEDEAVNYRWAGFHAGVSAGARFADAHWVTQSFALVPLDSTNYANYNGTGFRGALIAGYDWQIADRWIAGIEGDVGFGDKTTTLSGFMPGVSGSLPGGPILPGDESSVRTTWDASLRARLGYLVRPSMLAYGTGGIAWMHVEANSTCGAATCLSAQSSTDTQTLTGWTIGGGLETRLGQHWRARGEYRYADFGTMHASFSYFGIPTATADIRVQAHTGQFALLYDLN